MLWFAKKINMRIQEIKYVDGMWIHSSLDHNGPDAEVKTSDYWKAVHILQTFLTWLSHLQGIGLVQQGHFNPAAVAPN